MTVAKSLKDTGVSSTAWSQEKVKKKVFVSWMALKIQQRATVPSHTEHGQLKLIPGIPHWPALLFEWESIIMPSTMPQVSPVHITWSKGHAERLPATPMEYRARHKHMHSLQQLEKSEIVTLIKAAYNINTPNSKNKERCFLTSSNLAATQTRTLHSTSYKRTQSCVPKSPTNMDRQGTAWDHAAKNTIQEMEDGWGSLSFKTLSTVSGVLMRISTGSSIRFLADLCSQIKREQKAKSLRIPGSTTRQESRDQMEKIRPDQKITLVLQHERVSHHLNVPHWLYSFS